MEQFSSMAVKWEKKLRNGKFKVEETPLYNSELGKSVRGLKRSISSIYIPQNLKSLLSNRGKKSLNENERPVL